jgi:hypothetical protein
MAEQKPAKPKVSLDDVVRTASAYNSVSGVAERNTYASDLQSFYNYLSVKGKDPSEIPGIEDLGKNPARFSQMMGFTANLERKDLASKTESALADVAGKLDQNTLTNLALKLGAAKDKDYAVYSAALQNQDAGTVQAMYVAKYKDDALLMGYAQTASESDFLDYARVQVGKIQNKFIEKNLYTEETVLKDGKPVKAMKYNAPKAQRYLVSQVSGLKGEEKEEVLVQLGSIVMQIVAQDKAKKAKEAAAAKK